MPKRSRSTKKFKRRSEKKCRRGNFSTRIHRTVSAKGLFRPSSQVTMRFVETAQINPGSSGALTLQSYRFNSPYDPSTAVSTHQPMGFDQYMPFYEHFVVTSASIRVTYSNIDGVANKIVTLNRNNITGSPITNLIAATEQVGAQSRLLGKSSTNVVVLTDRLNMSEHFATRVLEERGYWGTESSDPVEGGVWAIGVASTDGSDPGPIQYLVDITYVVTLKEPKPLTGS